MAPPLLPGAVALSVLRMVVQVLEEQPQLLDHFAFLEDLPAPRGGRAVPWDVIDPAERRELALANLKEMIAVRDQGGRPTGSLDSKPRKGYSQAAYDAFKKTLLGSAPVGDPTE